MGASKGARMTGDLTGAEIVVQALTDLGVAHEPGVRVVGIGRQVVPLGHGVALMVARCGWGRHCDTVASTATTRSCSASVMPGYSGKVTARSRSIAVTGRSVSVS